MLRLTDLKNIPLEEALQNSETVGNIEMTSDFAYNREKIQQKLRYKLTELQEGVKLIQEGKVMQKAL